MKGDQLLPPPHFLPVRIRPLKLPEDVILFGKEPLGLSNDVFLFAGNLWDFLPYHL